MLQLSQTPRWNGRHKKWSAVLMLFVALSLALFNSLSVFANNVSSNVFEIGDGNTIDSPSGAPFDWENFFDGSGSHGTIARRANPDAAHFQAVSSGPDMGRNDPSTFTTGSKDTLNISSGWQCTSSNNLGGKFDLLNAYVLNYVGPVTSGGTPHNVLLFGGERDSNNGDANIGFWFLQDGNVACDSAGGTASFTGNHVNNDLFIVSSFTNGGSNSDIIVYRWVGGAAGHLDTAGEITGAPAD